MWWRLYVISKEKKVWPSADADLLKQAYEQPYTSFFTDDASVVEAMGVSVYLAAGNRENIKITTPFDLKIAAALLDSCLI